MRPSWDEYYLGIAEAVSKRADCTRRKAGSIIVRDHHILGQGYNGAPSGEPGCLTDRACPRGRHTPHEVLIYETLGGERFGPPREETVCGWDGKRWPCPDYVEPYSSYKDGPGRCIAIHSEDNALRKAARAGLDVMGATFYMVPGRPCNDCAQLIKDARIYRVVWPGGSYLVEED